VELNSSVDRGLGCARRGTGVFLTYNCSPDAAAGVVDRITDTGSTAVALTLDVAAQ
jgi:hypothetical protein